MTQTLERTMNETPLARMRRADCYAAEGRDNEAIRIYAQVCDEIPTAHVIKRLAGLYARSDALKDWASARTLYQVALRLDPKDEHCRGEYEALMQKQEQERAQEQFCEMPGFIVRLLENLRLI